MLSKAIIKQKKRFKVIEKTAKKKNPLKTQ